MATGNELAALRRRQGYCAGHFIRLSKKLNEIEQSVCPQESELIQIKNRLETYEMDLRAIQNEIIIIDEDETARGFEIADEYEKLELRVTNQLNNIRRTTPSQSTNGELAAGRESASLKLPEIRIPTFDGILEDWQSFYDSFSSTIDQNEQLTPVQKFYHLRSALTGWAARSIQSLAITESNYAIAIDVLKEKFDCHRQICMHHWDLIFDYPKITNGQGKPPSVRKTRWTSHFKRRPYKTIHVEAILSHHSQIATHITGQENAVIYALGRFSENTDEPR